MVPPGCHTELEQQRQQHDWEESSPADGEGRGEEKLGSKETRGKEEGTVLRIHPGQRQLSPKITYTWTDVAPFTKL